MDEFKGIVSLFIACIELLLFINILIFAEKNETNRKIILLIFLLFIYQLFEFLICYAVITSSSIIYLAFAAITLLPPLCLHIVTEYLYKGSKKYFFFYLPAVFILIYYLYSIYQFQIIKCTVLYAVYNYPLGLLYGVFYYSPVIIAFILLLNSYRKNIEEDKKKQVRILIIGFALTFIPMSIAVYFYPVATEFIESVLCKLALILALCFSLFALRNGNNKNILFNYLKKL